MKRFCLFISACILALTLFVCNSTFAANSLVIENDDTLDYEIDWAIMLKKGPAYWEGIQTLAQQDVFHAGKVGKYPSRDLQEKEQYHISIKRPLTAEEKANRPACIPQSANFLYCNYIVPKGQWKVKVSDIIASWMTQVVA